MVKLQNGASCTLWPITYRSEMSDNISLQNAGVSWWPNRRRTEHFFFEIGIFHFELEHL